MKNSLYRKAIVDGTAKDFLMKIAEESKANGFSDDYFINEAEKNAGDLLNFDLEDIIYEVVETVWRN